MNSRFWSWDILWIRFSGCFLREWAAKAKVEWRKVMEEEIRSPDRALTSCVTLGKLYVFSELLFFSSKQE